MGEWINIKIRLPEENKQILLRKDNIVFVGFYLSGNKYECCHCDGDCGCTYVENEDIYLMNAGFREIIRNWPEYNWVECSDYIPEYWMEIPGIITPQYIL